MVGGRKFWEGPGSSPNKFTEQVDFYESRNRSIEKARIKKMSLFFFFFFGGSVFDFSKGLFF